MTILEEVFANVIPGRKKPSKKHGDTSYIKLLI